ncbi:MAG: hypothetical protein LBB90_08285, partial [Tannerella sp.]|nr:hypothetical protein [Tannerella sp.]
MDGLFSDSSLGMGNEILLLRRFIILTVLKFFSGRFFDTCANAVVEPEVHNLKQSYGHTILLCIFVACETIMKNERKMARYLDPKNDLIFK